MINRKIVFVAGVHGVGKGTLCKKIMSFSEVEHVTASDLIRQRKELNKRKGVEGLLDNQELLLQSLSELSFVNKTLLLDGHFCLFNSNMEIFNIPIELYKTINISNILLITSKPETIYERILSRDKGDSGLELQHISSLQKAEIEHATLISSALNIPLMIVDNDGCLDSNQLKKLLNDFL